MFGQREQQSRATSVGVTEFSLTLDAGSAAAALLAGRARFVAYEMQSGFG